jgi:3-dehydroquinate dehydratase I
MNRFNMLVGSRKTSLVAVVASPEDLADAALLSPEDLEFCELRIDLLYQNSVDLEKAGRAIRVPKIITVRDPAEGGAEALQIETRRQLLEQWLPLGSCIDVEVRNLQPYSDLLQRAKSLGKGVILSFHDFGGTPTLKELEQILAQSRLVGNSIFKIATRVSQWSDVSTLIDLVEKNRNYPIAAMGMGEFGKLSRVVLARMGSCFTYCSLRKALIPGQWSYAKLREVLSEL